MPGTESLSATDVVMSEAEVTKEEEPANANGDGLATTATVPPTEENRTGTSQVSVVSLYDLSELLKIAHMTLLSIL